MKRSKADTAETRRRIVHVAAQEFRQKGIHQTGVAEIMASAGLTHGAFYRHFESKDQLVAEATAEGMDVVVDNAETAAETSDSAYYTHLKSFLSREYHEDALKSCPLVTLGSELARADTETRRAASQGFLELIDIISKQDGRRDTKAVKDDALFRLSAMIGAVTMARIVDDTALSDRILREARKRLAMPPTPLPSMKKIAAKNAKKVAAKTAAPKARLARQA
jgi:TetR/AcrR family transcriptional repressor of nem operon